MKDRIIIKCLWQFSITVSDGTVLGFAGLVRLGVSCLLCGIVTIVSAQSTEDLPQYQAPAVKKLNDPHIVANTDDGFNLTYFVDTGLAWLDATCTVDHSVIQIRKRITDPEDALFGYRYATQSEIDTLFASYDLPNLSLQAALAFLSDFGSTGGRTDGASTELMSPAADVEEQSRGVLAYESTGQSVTFSGPIEIADSGAHFLVNDRIAGELMTSTDQTRPTTPTVETNISGENVEILASASISGEQRTLQVGLWVGTAIINAVSVPASDNHSVARPTASPFKLRLIVYVDQSHNAYLLQHVNILKPSERETAAALRLVTDEHIVDSSEIIDARVSSIGFGFSQPLLASHSGTSYAFDARLPFDDPLNPFLHKYHPDHDNLNWKFEELSGNSSNESWGIVRSIQLQLSPAETTTAENPSNDDLTVSGVYDEVISGIDETPGLYKKDLVTQGLFQLTRIAARATLNGN